VALELYQAASARGHVHSMHALAIALHQVRTTHMRPLVCNNMNFGATRLPVLGSRHIRWVLCPFSVGPRLPGERSAGGSVAGGSNESRLRALRLYPRSALAHSLMCACLDNVVMPLLSAFLRPHVRGW
jgi:hypothetical protein